MDRRRFAAGLVAAGLALLLVFAIAWQGRRGQDQVRGIVTNVEARDLGHAAAITVRTTDGRELRFLVDPAIDPHWTPGHLRDHMLFGEPVTIAYRTTPQGRVAYRITD